MRIHFFKWAYWIFIVPLASFAQQNETATGYSNPFSQTKFVPDIAFILDCSYVTRNLKNAEFETLVVPGLIHSSAEEAEHGHEHAALNAVNGFNLNYGELMVSSVVDPYFNLMGVFHISEGGIEIEEGYFTTRMMPLGLQIKAGKFLSAFSRINEQHAHYWDFADAPLIQKAFFGGEGLNEKGIQLTWVAPLSMYWMFGGEILKGENESSFGTSGFAASPALTVEEKNTPNLITGFMRTSFDMGDLIVLAGLSGAFGNTRVNHEIDVSGEAGHAVSADTRILGGGITFKYLIDSNRYVSIQSEYIHRHMDGLLYQKDDQDAVDVLTLLRKQSGWYSQAVFKYGLRNRIGIRYDRIDGNGVRENDTQCAFPKGLDRFSAMVEFNPTEFSRIRLQYSLDRSLFLEDTEGFTRKTVNELLLQCNLSIGAHGAHPF